MVSFKVKAGGDKQFGVDDLVGGAWSRDSKQEDFATSGNIPDRVGKQDSSQRNSAYTGMVQCTNVVGVISIQLSIYVNRTLSGQTKNNKWEKI
jgi:hypothetical protein